MNYRAGKLTMTALILSLTATANAAGALEDDPLQQLQEYLTLSGTIEVEAGWSEDFAGTGESQISLATADLGLEVAPLDWLTATLALTWDDEEDTVTVDEAYLLLGDTETLHLLLQAGRFYLPFGTFEANTISDPLTKEAFEIREDALMVGYSLAGFSVAGYVFNGDTNEGGGDDQIEHYGVHFGYELTDSPVTVSVDSGYISSIMDTDTLSEDADLEADYVGGVFAQAVVGVAGFSFIAEYITAIDDYEPAEAESRKPTSFHLEGAYSVELGLPLTFALSYSQSNDLAEIVPETRVAAAVGVELADGLSTTFEYCHDTDYEVTDGGTGEEGDSVTLQLAYEF